MGSAVTLPTEPASFTERAETDLPSREALYNHQLYNTYYAAKLPYCHTDFLVHPQIFKSIQTADAVNI